MRRGEANGLLRDQLDRLLKACLVPDAHQAGASNLATALYSGLGTKPVEDVSQVFVTALEVFHKVTAFRHAVHTFQIEQGAVH